MMIANKSSNILPGSLTPSCSSKSSTTSTVEKLEKEISMFSRSSSTTNSSSVSWSLHSPSNTSLPTFSAPLLDASHSTKVNGELASLSDLLHCLSQFCSNLLLVHGSIEFQLIALQTRTPENRASLSMASTRCRMLSHRTTRKFQLTK